MCWPERHASSLQLQSLDILSCRTLGKNGSLPELGPTLSQQSTSWGRRPDTPGCKTEGGNGRAVTLICCRPSPNTEAVALTMTLRCSTGVASLSVTAWISFISPVSLSIRNRPSSSPSMDTHVVAYSYPNTTHCTSDLAWVCVVPERMA